jgi:hypothetical protein
MESTMNRKPAAPEVPGIALAFRPKSYFWPLGLETHLLARIKGAERKEIVRRLIDAGDLNSVPELILQSALSDDVRQVLGRIHPAMMGGEYLPNLTSNEVEIARIRIASTTQDVTSVYARRGKNRIYYRMVDEYEGGSLSKRRTRTSTRPLTLRALETFFNGAWSIFDVLEGNFGDDDYVIEDMLAFTRVESQFYPQIAVLYRRRIEAWAAARRAEQVIDRAREGGERFAGPELGPRHE